MTNSSDQSRRDFLRSAALLGGAASLGGCAVPSQVQSNPAATFVGGRPRYTPSFFPRHNERTKGWLRFIWQKATTPDDWGYSESIERPWGIRLPRGPIDWREDRGGPHPWWDQYTAAPMLSYPRFDLVDSSYGVMLMADQTPAWREVYTRILDEYATRHTSHWAAIDWNTFIGPSPDRGNYPEAVTRAWPERLRGNYDAPGWTANGVQPWGLQPDPIGADGNLFFRGWLNLLLGVYRYVSGDDKWERPWQVAGYENQRFEWTQPRIVEHLRRQYTEHPEGPHCENTKVWPLCNSSAGLGIYLSDQLANTNAHGVFENWIEFMKDNYMGINGRNEIEWMTSYYDPLEDFKVNTPGGGSIGVAFYLLPQSPEIATQIYDAIANTAGWRDPRREIRPSSLGLVMARALGDHTAVARLSAAAERDSEPRWFGNDLEKFGWWFNNGEPWPRGQGSAQMMMSEIAESNWLDVFTLKHLDKYTAPTLEGVDYPGLGVDTAWNDKRSGVLFVGTYAADRQKAGQSTSWTITNLPDAAAAVVIRDGATMSNIEVVNATTIRVPTQIGEHQYQIYTGYFGPGSAARADRPAAVPDATMAAGSRAAAERVRAAETLLASGAVKCPCCAQVA